MTNHHSTHQSANTAVRDAMNSVKPCDDDTAFARIQSQLPSARQITAMGKQEKAPRRSVLRPTISIGLVLACTAAVVGVVGYNMQGETPTETTDVAGGGRQGVPVQLPGAQPLPQMEIGDRLPLQWAEPVSDGGRVVDIPDSAAQEVTVQGQTIRVKPLIYGDAKFVQVTSRQVWKGGEEKPTYWVDVTARTPQELSYSVKNSTQEWEQDPLSKKMLDPDASAIYRFPSTGKNGYGFGLGETWWERFDITTPEGARELYEASLKEREHRVLKDGLFNDCLVLLGGGAHSAEERSAVLTLLGSMPDVKVKKETFQGQPVVSFAFSRGTPLITKTLYVDMSTGHLMGQRFTRESLNQATMFHRTVSLSALPPGLVSSWKSMEGRGFCSWRKWADGPIEICSDARGHR